jgi:hypothetical protein
MVNKKRKIALCMHFIVINVIIVLPVAKSKFVGILHDLNYGEATVSHIGFSNFTYHQLNQN